MNLLPVFELAFSLHLASHVDSELETTRVYWRKKFFNASDAEARDPRPFEEVLSKRIEQGDPS